MIRFDRITEAQSRADLDAIRKIEAYQIAATRLRNILAVIGAAALVSGLAGAARANDTHSWAMGSSYVTLRPSDAPGAVAEVEFANEPVDGDSVEMFDLSLGGFSVSDEVLLGRGVAPDEISVTPPDGYIAVPPVMDVPEGQSRTITIYRMDGVGM